MAIKKNPLKEFLNECNEWHALWVGFAQSWMRFKLTKLPKSLQSDVKKEYHYYLLGSFIARLLQIGVLILIGTKIDIKLLLRVFGL